ncbi:hypothetical protein JWJ88_09400 [Paracoccus methylovorus]|uniref:Uncharacterized protein n=1 Tax=Paracoccus methylovorus TaxID=2812658 RepID=A0ABX7JIY6_9RHOB|nr:hypothetical protein [Paracoccus methylovorus]QRZ14212.1 hypothetical protein JWJ88_09400 [Paracoccus methylovorus]
MATIGTRRHDQPGNIELARVDAPGRLCSGHNDLRLFTCRRGNGLGAGSTVFARDCGPGLESVSSDPQHCRLIEPARTHEGLGHLMKLGETLCCRLGGGGGHACLGHQVGILRRDAGLADCQTHLRQVTCGRLRRVGFQIVEHGFSFAFDVEQIGRPSGPARDNNNSKYNINAVLNYLFHL